MLSNGYSNIRCFPIIILKVPSLSGQVLDHQQRPISHAEGPKFNSQYLQKKKVFR